MKKKVCLLALLVLLLTACAARMNLMPEGSPDTSALSLYVYDGDTVTCRLLFDTNAEKAILKDFQNAKAAPADLDVTALTPPFYGLEIGGADGRSVYGLWSDGYFLTGSGSAYKFDYDFETLLERYDWDEPDTYQSLTVMPCASHVAKTEDGWNPSFLTPSSSLKQPEGISMELVSLEDGKIRVRFANQSGQEWTYGYYYSLQVLLDGAWYQVPPQEEYGVIDLACILPDGESREETYNLSFFGQLPPGTYRLVAEQLTAEFTVE